VRAALEKTGSRYTRQREAVFAYLHAVDSHPTVEEVYRAVQRRLPRVSLATVYKALEALVAAHLATRIASGSHAARFDCRGEDHYHLRDVATGEVRDLATLFDGKLLDKLDPRLVTQLAAEGFQVTGYRLEVLGRYDHK